MLPIFFVLAVNGQAYTADVLMRWQKGAVPALKALLASAAFMVFASFCLRSTQGISRIMFSASIVSGAMLLLLTRSLLHLYVRRVLGDRTVSNVLI